MGAVHTAVRRPTVTGAEVPGGGARTRKLRSCRDDHADRVRVPVSSPTSPRSGWRPSPTSSALGHLLGDDGAQDSPRHVARARALADGAPGAGSRRATSRAVRARVRAARSSVISGGEALRRHGLRRLPRPTTIHVLVEQDRRRTSSGLRESSGPSACPSRSSATTSAVAPLERAVVDTVRRTRTGDEVRARRPRASVFGSEGRRSRGSWRRARGRLAAGHASASRGPARDRGRHPVGGRGLGTRPPRRRADLPPVLWNPQLSASRRQGTSRGPTPGSPTSGSRGRSIPSSTTSARRWDATARGEPTSVAAGVIVVAPRPRRLLAERPVVDELWGYLPLAASRPRPLIRATPISRAA